MGLRRNERINNTFRIRDKLDAGGQGEVYSARDRDGHEYAVKVCRGSQCMRHEYQTYRRLGCIDSYRQFLSRVYYYSDSYNGQSVMVMSRFQISLANLRRRIGGKLSVPTVLKIGTKVVRMLKYVHSKGIIHGDVKPHNIMLKRGSRGESNFFLVDFGCSTTYLRDDSGYRHIRDAHVGFFGTILFASTRTQEGRNHCRKDDLQSLTYMLVYLVRGTLPWKHFDDSGRDADVLASKRRMSTAALCSGIQGLPEFAEKIWRLSFEEQPDYLSLLRILDRGIFKLTGTYGVDYDWDDLDERD